MKLSISRHNPEHDHKPYMQDYEIELIHSDHMLLDVLIRLKAQDNTLTLRKSCGEGVCGSDAMNINGRNGLACITRLSGLREPVVVRPLPSSPIIRDLVVDMKQLLQATPLDRATQERLDDLNDAYRLFRCRTIMNCSEVCPKGLEPAHAIEMIRLKMLNGHKDGALQVHPVPPIR